MNTRVTSDGQIALPEAIRTRLGIRAGDTLKATVVFENGGQRILLTPEQPQEKYELKIVTDPLTGWLVLSAGPNAPVMTSEDVAGCPTSEMRVPQVSLLRPGSDAGFLMNFTEN